MVNNKGQFKRKHNIWNHQNWDDGYVDSDGRFRVYRPDYPHAYALGYALRAHIVWWLHYGEAHSRKFDLHHKDKNRLNDAIENLELMTAVEHQRHHKKKTLPILVCERCGRRFQTKKSQDKSRSIRFCSQGCYHATPKPESQRLMVSKQLKEQYRNGTRRRAR